MIKVAVTTPRGLIYAGDATSLVVRGDTGEVGILTDRIPLMMKATEGYVKITAQTVRYVAVQNAVVDFKDNRLTVIAEYASVDDSAEKAFANIKNEINALLLSNKKKNIDFIVAEKELYQNIKKIKAAHLD